MATNGASSSKPKADGNFTLYYTVYSYYSQKVLFALYEKKLKFKHHGIDLQGEQYSSWFMKMNPKGEVPVLKDGEKIICDSAVIFDYLEENYSNEQHPSLLPEKGTESFQKERKLRKLLETFPTTLLTFGCVFFPELTVNMKMNSFERKTRSNIFNVLLGVLEKNINRYTEFKTNYLEKKKIVETKIAKLQDINNVLQALEDVENMLKTMEEELASHSSEKEEWWLCSKNFTMADVILSVSLRRLKYLGLWEKFFDNGKNPHLEKYYNRIQQRESFKKVFSQCPLISHILCSNSTKKGLIAATGVAVAIGIAATGAVLYHKLKH